MVVDSEDGMMKKLENMRLANTEMANGGDDGDEQVLAAQENNDDDEFGGLLV
jgi:hypothetical protein